MLLAGSVVALAGCGGHAATLAPATTAVTSTAPKKSSTPHAPAPSPAVRRFAGLELAYAREDLVAGTLAARKASTPSVHAAALRRVRTVTADAAALARLARPARLTAVQRRTYDTYYESLVDNAGYRLDDAYEQGTEARDRAEAALARSASARRSSLARRIVRERTADDVLLRTIGG